MRIAPRAIALMNSDRSNLAVRATSERTTDGRSLRGPPAGSPRHSSRLGMPVRVTGSESPLVGHSANHDSAFENSYGDAWSDADTPRVGLRKVLQTGYVPVIARRTSTDPDTRLVQLTLYAAEERPLRIRDAAETVR